MSEPRDLRCRLPRIILWFILVALTAFATNRTINYFSSDFSAKPHYFQQSSDI